MGVYVMIVDESTDDAMILQVLIDLLQPICFSLGFLQISLQAQLACTKKKENLNLEHKRGLEGNLHEHNT